MLSMTELHTGQPYPRWTEADWVELMLLHKKLPVGPRRLLRAAADGQPPPPDAADAARFLDELCDAFRRAPIVVIEGGDLRLDVVDPAWVRTVLDR
jgi:hypothetical protein